jgi:hypothetical protein
METLPPYIAILFGGVVLATIGFLYNASGSQKLLWAVVIWTALQSVLGLSGVYQNTESMPPRIMILGILPALLGIVYAMTSKAGRRTVDGMDLKRTTLLHTIRIPVEIVLALLIHEGVLSVYMSWEGSNFDILSGISAPIVAYLAFRNRTPRRQLLLWWNGICLLLLLNVVVTAIFAFPSPFQQLAFDQPNVAILHFPFNLLPSVVVPIVLFSHLAAIRQLRRTDTP